MTQPEGLRRKAAAEFCGISAALLAKLARNGEGPKTCRIGRTVVYPITELRSWMASKVAA